MQDPSPSAPWPPGFGLTLDPATRRLEGGRLLVGGQPGRIVRLSPAGQRLLAGLQAGEPVPAGEAAGRFARRLVRTGRAHPRPAAVAGGAGVEEVTVVVPVRHDPGGLARTLAAAGTCGGVVVIEDDHHPARGPAATRNIGWRRATTPLVAFVDAGCEPQPGWLPPLLAHLADPAVGAVAPRVMAPARTGAGLLARYEARSSPLDMGPVPAAVRPGSRVPFVPSAALVVRREALESGGGFDEALHHGEDVDLVWRLHQAGWDVRYEPGVVVSHPPRANFGAWAFQRYGYGGSAAPLHRRHPGALAPTVIPPRTLASLGLVAAGHPALAALAALAGRGWLARSLPWQEVVLLTARAHLAATRQLARATVRAWWPATTLAALAWRPVRRPLAAAALLPPALAWWEAHLRGELGLGGGLGLPACVLLRLADDLAYGAGVWAGCWAHRTCGPLVPRLSPPLVLD
jgi:mycofactocin system glycosyltransferase